MVLTTADVGGQRDTTTASGIAVAGEVHLWGGPTAEYVKEGYVDIREFSGGTSGGKSSLVAVLAPVNGDAAISGSGDSGGR